MLTVAAQIFAFLTLIVVLFQLALLLGAPWGHLAMGGRFPGKFPPKMRIAALVQAILLCVLGLVVLIRAKMLLPSFYTISETAIWVVVIINCLSLVMNLATPSRWERIIWAPIVTMLVISSLIVAWS